jgi:tetratricopeptide (TPR) repeat protein
MGVAYNGLGKYQEAIDAYKEAIKIKPDFHEAYHNMGVAYIQSIFQIAMSLMKIRINLNGFFESINGFLILS